MTSVPTDPKETERYAYNAPAFGYHVFFMNRNISNHDIQQPFPRPLNTVIIAARTESDGSSSNWVTHIDPQYRNGTPDPTTVSN
ncbi:MAG: hypothetical protein WCJ81_03745 [bacterium]